MRLLSYLRGCVCAWLTEHFGYETGRYRASFDSRGRVVAIADTEGR